MINLGNDVILFGSSDCPACVMQVKLLNDYFNSNRKIINIKYFNLKEKAAPSFLLDSKGNYSMPAWYFPSNKKLESGILKPNEFMSRYKKSTHSFGELKNAIPQINTLKKYGKNFPDYKGFKINDSFDNKLTKKWGNPILSGTLGREFGPGRTDEIYKDRYFNNIRMAYPGGDLDTTDFTNRECNIINNPQTATKTVGFLYDSKNKQLNASNFGRRKKKNNFGNYSSLYSQMGPAFEKNNEYVVKRNTVAKLYGGALQFEKPKPIGLSKLNPPFRNVESYLANQKKYTPLKPGNLRIKKYVNKFGTKNKIKEGDVLTLKKNKINVN